MIHKISENLIFSIRMPMKKCTDLVFSKNIKQRILVEITVDSPIRAGNGSSCWRRTKAPLNTRRILKNQLT
jgi:hypothetical protein